MNAKGLGEGGCCQWRLGPPAGECPAGTQGGRAEW